MTSLSRKIQIDARPEKVWYVLSDLESVQDFSPGVAKAYYTSKVRTGVGASRHCDLQNPGGYVEERITDWQEGKGFTIEIHESNAPLKSAFGRFTLRPIETVRFWRRRVSSIRQGTVVTFTVDYQLKFGPMGALMDLLMARRQFQKSADALVSGLKHFVETGERVGERIPAAAEVCHTANEKPFRPRADGGP